MKRLEFDLLFRWFIGLGWIIRRGTFDHFEEPRPALGGRHCGEVPGCGAGAAAGYDFSTDHFSVDGTLIGSEGDTMGVMLLAVFLTLLNAREA